MGAYTIYISSTYRDLIEDRDLLRKRLDQAQYTTVCMEKYPPALSKEIKEKCQDDVKKADIYIGIIGENYGSLAKDEMGNELPYSYTEYEYDAAVESKRKRLIFLKKPKAVITDQRLLNFIKKINTSPFLMGQFEEPAELPALVLASIIAETGDYEKKIIPAETKYFCDRSDQADFFKDHLIKNINRFIYFFMICGHKYNGHALMVKRCICSMQQLFGNKETLDIILMANSNPPSDAEKIKEDIKKKVLRQLELKTGEPIPAFSGSCFMECLNKLNKSCLVISIIIQSSFLKDHIEVYKKGVEKFYNEFSQQETAGYKDKKIVFFIHVQYADEVIAQNTIIHDFENVPYFIERRMPLLNKINDINVNEWMIEYNLEDNQAEIDKRIKEFFATIERDENDEYYMDNAENAMEKVIDYYNINKLNG